MVALLSHVALDDLERYLPTERVPATYLLEEVRNSSKFPRDHRKVPGGQSLQY